MTEQLYHDRSDFNVLFVHSSLDDYGLSPSEFRVYCHLARRAGTGEAWPSVSSIADHCGFKTSDPVRSAIKGLIAFNMIEVTERPGTTSLYRLTKASEWVPRDSVDPSRQTPLLENTPTGKQEGYPSRKTGGDPSGKTGGEVNTLKGIQSKGIQSQRLASQAQPDPNTSRPEDEAARRLCDLLVALMLQNGCRQPTITRDWLSAARLLITKDGITESEAQAVMRWSQAHEFWRSNILSMPTFRKQFDRLRLAAQRSMPPGRPDDDADDDILVQNTRRQLQRRHDLEGL